MMRNEYFSDGFFEGYDWAVEQFNACGNLANLAVRAEQKMSSVPFSNGEDARQWRDGFVFGVKSACKESMSQPAEDSDEEPDRGSSLYAA